MIPNEYNEEEATYRGYGIPEEKKKRDWRPYYLSTLGILAMLLTVPLFLWCPWIFIDLKWSKIEWEAAHADWRKMNIIIRWILIIEVMLLGPIQWFGVMFEVLDRLWSGRSMLSITNLPIRFKREWEIDNLKGEKNNDYNDRTSNANN
jgi:hypothetical protein